MFVSKNNRRGTVIALIALLLAAAGLLTAYLLLRPQTKQGDKTVIVEVVFADGSTHTHTILTDAKYLRGALEQDGMVGGQDSAMGLFVTTVDGVTADDSLQQWWSFSKNGESLMTGVDTTPVADGDRFVITLTTGYDS